MDTLLSTAVVLAAFAILISSNDMRGASALAAFFILVSARPPGSELVGFVLHFYSQHAEAKANLEDNLAERNEKYWKVSAYARLSSEVEATMRTHGLWNFPHGKMRCRLHSWAPNTCLLYTSPSPRDS